MSQKPVLGLDILDPQAKNLLRLLIFFNKTSQKTISFDQIYFKFINR